MRRFAAIAALAFAQGAAAQGYPSRPITMVVGFAPGGGTDSVARVLAKKVGESIGQTVIVENKAAAGGTVAVHQVARSAPDGYTIALANVGSMAVWPHLNPKLPYDALRDLAPITMAVEFPNLIVVNPTLPAKTLAELVQLAKAKPGTISYDYLEIRKGGSSKGKALMRLLKHLSIQSSQGAVIGIAIMILQCFRLTLLRLRWLMPFLNY